MNARTPPAILLLLSILACKSIENGTDTPQADRADARLAHAREAEPWRRFDANLEMLYRARQAMRGQVLLPPEPELEN